MAIIRTLKIEVEGKEKQVTGGDFYDMLESVKAIPDRRWDGDRKLWILPVSMAEAQEMLAEDGFTILGDEDEVIEAEIKQIKSTKDLLIQNKELLVAEISRLHEQVSSYSYNSKSSVKARFARDEGCLRGALKALDKSINSLTEIEIRSMQRACKILEIE